MNFQNLSSTQKGTVFVAIGVILLLYTLGIFKQAFQFVIVIGALFLIFYGFMLGDFWTKIKAFIEQFKKPKQ